MKIVWMFSSLCLLGAMYLFIVYSNNEIWPDKIKLMSRIHIKEKIYPNYYDEDVKREWPFNITKNYIPSNLYQWNETHRSININSNGIGEGGVGFVPSDEAKELMEQLYEENNYNILASDTISLHRSIPDSRSDECKMLSYPKILPTASVIIILHNEGWSTLLRTVWSIINRSPSELIEEIILVDDMSTSSFLKRPLQNYIELLPVRIKLLRTLKREGLIRARLIGAEQAKGNVLIFLDAHMECNEGWLQPLLARIASDRSVIAVPVIDSINSTDMSYQYNDQVLINGFGASLIFNWLPVPERELIRTHYDNTAPVRTPTMVGCGFSIDREFFFEIGSYDKGMNIWGSENIEMSLRVWQCGGSIQIIPCSRIAHLFRLPTYSFDGDAFLTKAQNNMRLVEVWMTDLKELYYTASNIENKNLSPGDLTERQELKQRLKCKDLRWYLENIYPENNMLKEFVSMGEVQSESEKMCLDCGGGVYNPLTLSSCHGEGGNQFFAFAKNYLIVTSLDYCVSVDHRLQEVVTLWCNDEDSQLLKYDSERKWLVHIASGLCLQANKTKVILGKCDSANISFNWEINSNPDSGNIRNAVIDFGEIKSTSENKCLAIQNGDNSSLVMLPCHSEDPNQLFFFTKNQMLVTSTLECFGVNEQLHAVLLVECSEKESQFWEYDNVNKLLVHIASGLCMLTNKTEVILGKCDPVDISYNWEINSLM